MHDRDAFIRDVVGLDLEPARLQAVLTAFSPILAEIEKLRALDLGEIHPAVIFDPAPPMPTP